MDSQRVDPVLLTTPKWRMLIRQHSEKLGELAEDVVLPKNERLIRRVSRNEDISIQNIESQYPDRSLDDLHSEGDRFKQFPAFMIGISLIQILLYYLVDEDVLLLIFGYDPHRRHEIWRFITIMLVHSGLSHLWNNVTMQLILGSLLEIVHHWKRIAIIYLASVLGGSLFISVIASGYTVGASAGVYGLLFSHLATIILNWNEMDRKFCRLFFLLFYIAYDLGLTLHSEFVLKKDSHISHAGHIGGALTGFLVSILVLKNFKKHPWEKKMQKICIGLLTAICVVAILINLTAWGHYLPTEWNVQYMDSYVKDFLISVKKSSELTKECEEDELCKLQLDQFNFNGTVST